MGALNALISKSKTWHSDCLAHTPRIAKIVSKTAPVISFHMRKEVGN